MLSISRSIFWIWQRSLTEPDKSASKKINSSFLSWWAHLDANQGPTGYEPVALPTELWAPSGKYIHVFLNLPILRKYHLLCQGDSKTPSTRWLPAFSFFLLPLDKVCNLNSHKPHLFLKINLIKERKRPCPYIVLGIRILFKRMGAGYCLKVAVTDFYHHCLSPVAPLFQPFHHVFRKFIKGLFHEINVPCVLLKRYLPRH